MIVKVRNSRGEFVPFYLVPYGKEVKQWSDKKLIKVFISPFAKRKKNDPNYATVWVDLKNGIIFIYKYLFYSYKWYFIKTPFFELYEKKPKG